MSRLLQCQVVHPVKGRDWMAFGQTNLNPSMCSFSHFKRDGVSKSMHSWKAPVICVLPWNIPSGTLALESNTIFVWEEKPVKIIGNF